MPWFDDARREQNTAELTQIITFNCQGVFAIDQERLLFKANSRKVLEFNIKRLNEIELIIL